MTVKPPTKPDYQELGRQRGQLLREFFGLIDQIKAQLAAYTPEVLAACDRYYLAESLQMDLDQVASDPDLEGWRDMYSQLSNMLSGYVPYIEGQMRLHLKDFFGGGPMYGDLKWIGEQTVQLREILQKMGSEMEYRFPTPQEYERFLKG